MTIVLSSFKARIETTERELVVEALTVSNGCVSQAARLTGLHRWQLNRIIYRHGLQALKHPGKPGAPLKGNDAWRALA